MVVWILHNDRSISVSCKTCAGHTPFHLFCPYKQHPYHSGTFPSPILLATWRVEISIRSQLNLNSSCHSLIQGFSMLPLSCSPEGIAFIWAISVDAPGPFIAESLTNRFRSMKNICPCFDPLVEKLHSGCFLSGVRVNGWDDVFQKKNQNDWPHLLQFLCVQSQQVEMVLMGTFSTYLFWVPSNDSQRPRSQARPRSTTCISDGCYCLTVASKRRGDEKIGDAAASKIDRESSR